MHLIIGFALLSLASSLPLETTQIQNISNFNYTAYQELLKTNEILRYYDDLAHDCSYLFIVSGGSTAANTGDNLTYTPTDNVLMWNYTLPGWQPATTQLANCDGNGYSYWALVGANVSNATKSRVCLIGAARQDSCINEWHPITGKYNYLLKNAMMIGQKYAEPQFLWSQGECDSRNPSSNYMVYLTDVVYSFPNNTWFISETSYTPETTYNNEEVIRQGQSHVVHQLHNAYAGPNTDALCIDYRYTDNTFNKYGQLKLKSAWVDAYNQMSDAFTLGDYHCSYKIIRFWDMVLSFFLIVGFAMMFAAFSVGIYFMIRGPNRIYKNTVHYYVVPNYGSEKQSLLTNRT